jgi:hypothetical protein
VFESWASELGRPEGPRCSAGLIMVVKRELDLGFIGNACCKVFRTTILQHITLILMVQVLFVSPF